MESENVKCYELGNKNYDIKKNLYNEDEILEEELNQMISDDLIRDAILIDVKNKNNDENVVKEYIEKHNKDKECLLYDLSLLENTSELPN